MTGSGGRFAIPANQSGLPTSRDAPNTSPRPAAPRRKRISSPILPERLPSRYQRSVGAAHSAQARRVQTLQVGGMRRPVSSGPDPIDLSMIADESQLLEQKRRRACPRAAVLPASISTTPPAHGPMALLDTIR